MRADCGGSQRRAILRVAGVDDWLTCVSILQSRQWNADNESSFFAALFSFLLGWSNDDASREAFLRDILECYLKQCRSSSSLLSCSGGLLSVICLDSNDRCQSLKCKLRFVNHTVGARHFLVRLDSFLDSLQCQSRLLGLQVKSVSGQLDLARKRATVVRSPVALQSRY